MQTVILCGGKGTRIVGSGPEKKELVEIGGRPILWHIMKVFATYGHEQFVLPLGHRGDLIRRYFSEYEWMNRDLHFRLGQPDKVCYEGEHDEGEWQITLVDTGLEISPGVEVTKGERLRRVRDRLTGARFFLTYGDSLGDVDVGELLRFHRAHGKRVTVTGYQPVYRYGVIEASDKGKVTAYHQYPRLEHWVNAGYMVVERSALDALEPGMELETDFFGRLVQSGQLMVYRHAGFWRSMDTLKESQELNEIWASGQAPWKVW